MSTKTVLITGVNGFIGSHVARRLARDYQVVGLGASSVDTRGLCHRYIQMMLPHPDFIQVLAHYQPACCLHFAGSASVAGSFEHPGVDFQSGPAAVFQILDALRQNQDKGGPCLFVFPSSAAVYGNPTRLPVAESDPINPISPYGYHKRMSENLAEEFRALYGVPYLILRIFSCYGPGLRKQLLWDLCRKIDSGRVELYGTGEETRDYIHVTDLAALVALLLGQAIRDTVLNVGNGLEVSTKTVAETMLRAIGRDDLRPVFRGREKTGDPLHWRCDCSRLRDLGYARTMDMDAGIAQYAHWYKANALQEGA